MYILAQLLVFCLISGITIQQYKKKNQIQDTLSPPLLTTLTTTLLGSALLSALVTYPLPFSMGNSYFLTETLRFTLWITLSVLGFSFFHGVFTATLHKEKSFFRWEESLLLLLVLTISGLTFVHIFTSFNLFFHSDQATPNLLALEQWRTKSLFPQDWHYGTSIWIIFHNIFMIPLSLLSKDQLFLQNLSVLGLVIATCSLLLYLSCKFLKSHFYLLFFCYFFANTSYMFIDMSFAAASYLPWLFEFCLFITLFFSSFNEDFSIKSKKYATAFFLYAIYLLLYGVQFLIFHHIPLLGGVLLTFLLEHSNKKEIELRPYYQNLTIFAIISLTALFFGSLIHGFLISNLNYNSVSTSYSSMEDFFDRFIIFLLNALGYQGEVKLFSVQGIMNFIIVAVFFLSLHGAIQLYKNYNKLPYHMKIFANICLLSILFTVYFNFAIYSKYLGYIRYLYKALIPLYLLSSYYYYEFYRKKGFIPKILLLLTVLCYTLPSNLAYAVKDLKYTSLHQEQTTLTDYLQEQNLTYGYGTFWHAYEHMVLSDFNVMINGILISDEKITPHLWLTSEYYYTPEAFETHSTDGRSFLLFTPEEETLFLETKTNKILGTPAEIHTIDNYIIYVYNFNVSDNEFLGTIQNLDLLPTLSIYGGAERIGTQIQLDLGQRAFGPFLTLPAGTYQVEISTKDMVDGYYLQLTAGCGSIILRDTEYINENKTQLTFHVPDTITDFELVFTTEDYLILESLTLSKQSE